MARGECQGISSNNAGKLIDAMTQGVMWTVAMTPNLTNEQKYLTIDNKENYVQKFDILRDGENNETGNRIFHRLFFSGNVDWGFGRNELSLKFSLPQVS